MQDISFLRYKNISRKAVKDHEETLALTKGNVALGGGDLALLGSGCLWTWPEEMADVFPAFQDNNPVDSRHTMDDSAYRYGCLSTQS